MRQMPLKNWLVLAAVCLCAALGEACLKHGMSQFGVISWTNAHMLFAALLNPWIVVGTILLIGFFSSYLAALSWADLTYVLPATALGYVVTALIARFALNEAVSPARWAGVLLITAAVGLIARGPSLTVPSDMVEGSAKLARAAGEGQ